MELTSLTLFVGIILPPVMGLITRFIKDSDARFWSSVVMCLLIGAIVNFINHNGNYNGIQWNQIVNSVLESGLTLIGLSKISYEAVWNNKSIGKVLPDEIIEGKQSPMQALNLKPKP